MRSDELYILESQVAMTVFYELLRAVQNAVEKIDVKSDQLKLIYDGIEKDVAIMAKEFYNPSNNANFFYKRR